MIRVEDASVPVAVAMVSDLIFGSRIIAEGKSAGMEVRTIASPAALSAIMAEEEVRLVLVDMTAGRQAACEAIASAARHAGAPAIVAFYPHVDAELREAAAAAGAGIVLPRSRFVQELPDILRRCLAE